MAIIDFHDDYERQAVTGLPDLQDLDRETGPVRLTSVLSGTVGTFLAESFGGPLASLSGAVA